MKSQVLCPCMGYCNCGIGCIVFLGKQPGNGFANNIGTPDDNYFRPIKIDSGSAQNLLYPGGRAWNKTILSAACQQFAKIQGMKSIHILVRVNCIHNCLFINAFRQGKLDKNAMHIVIFIVFFNQGMQFGFSGFFRKIDLDLVKTKTFGCFNLAGHITCGSGVIAHKNGYQARRFACFFYNFTNFRTQFIQNLP